LKKLVRQSSLNKSAIKVDLEGGSPLCLDGFHLSALYQYA